MTGLSALIGHTGFVGSNILRQRQFDEIYNSTSIQEIDGKVFAETVCAGVTAVKWWANQNAEEDLRRIKGLIAHLDKIDCAHFTLISTVDVYSDCAGVTEDTPISLDGLHAYGRNRALLEDYVKTRFERHMVVRLPALFGAGLKKNAVFDLMHDNRLSYIHPDSTFQWYPLARLQADLARAQSLDLRVVNLSVEPVAMAAIAARYFARKRLGGDVSQPTRYDMRSKYAEALGGRGGYVMTADTMMDELGRFLERPEPQ